MYSNMKNYHSKLVSWVFFFCCHRSTPWVSVLSTCASLHAHLRPLGNKWDGISGPLPAGLACSPGREVGVTFSGCHVCHARRLSRALLQPLADVPFHNFCPFKVVRWFHPFNSSSFEDYERLWFYSLHVSEASENIWKGARGKKGDTGLLRRPESRGEGRSRRQVEPVGLHY